MLDKIETFTSITINALFCLLFVFLFSKSTMAVVIVIFILGFVATLLLLYLLMLQVEIWVEVGFNNLEEKLNKMLDKNKKS